MPKFKVRRYGCKTLGKLYEKLDRYELVMTEKGVANAILAEILNRMAGVFPKRQFLPYIVLCIRRN